MVLLALVALLMPGSAAMASDEVDEAIWTLMANMNLELEAIGANIRVEMVEYYTNVEQADMGRTVFFSNRGNKQLGFDFVPGDPRRTWSGSGEGDDITWATDLSQGDAGVGLGLTQTAISNAMQTWDDVSCSNLPLTQVDAGAGNIGFLELLLFGTGSVPVADVTHAGFDSLVDLLLPPPTIAATFTFRFTDELGNDTDIDNNGVPDAALREIYYTNNFLWGVGNNIDIETVVLHETGHALSQQHFGSLHRTESNGKFHFSPAAVMNAGYTAVRREITATDNGGHCSNWGSWPNN